MNEDDTFKELAIGGLLDRREQLQKEWNIAMEDVDAAIFSGNLAGMNPATCSAILKEIGEIEEKIIQYYNRQMDLK